MSLEGLRSLKHILTLSAKILLIKIGRYHQRVLLTIFLIDHQPFIPPISKLTMADETAPAASDAATRRPASPVLKEEVKTEAVADAPTNSENSAAVEVELEKAIKGLFTI